MVLIIPCIKGKMGNVEYFQATMRASELVHRVRPASELDEWTTMSIEDRLQREPNDKRIKNEIAPYIAQTKDRFFGSFIVLVYQGKIDFEPFEELSSKLLNSDKNKMKNMGVITINGGSLIVLDGQHRLLALEKVIKAQVIGDYREEVPNDELCIIFINHESSEKTRRIFNKVNRYAKPTSKGDNIITSEDDGYAIIARRLLDVGAPLGVRDKGNKAKPNDAIVEWKNDALAVNSTKLTTISVVYETAKQIWNHENTPFDVKHRPGEEELIQAYELIKNFWNTVLREIRPYREALEDSSCIPQMREKEYVYSLLFKPIAQKAFFQGLIIATKNERLALDEAARRANKIDWRMTSPIWTNILVSPNSNIKRNNEEALLAAKLIAYLIAADKMEKDEIEDIRRSYNNARGNHPELSRKQEPLPTPVVAEFSFEDSNIAAKFLQQKKSSIMNQFIGEVELRNLHRVYCEGTHYRVEQFKKSRAQVWHTYIIPKRVVEYLLSKLQGDRVTVAEAANILKPACQKFKLPYSYGKELNYYAQAVLVVLVAQKRASFEKQGRSYCYSASLC